jgi:acyl-coenzyme A thioesterase PaaI-like protein
VPGGWLSALLDSALGCAVQTVVPGGAVYHASIACSVLSR